MFLIVAIGVYPRPIFQRISPAVRAISDRFQLEPLPTPPAVAARAPIATGPQPLALHNDRDRDR
jgi:hypothetical protein